jgi:hypothetical protein
MSVNENEHENCSSYLNKTTRNATKRQVADGKQTTGLSKKKVATGTVHGLMSYMDTKAKGRHLTN